MKLRAKRRLIKARHRDDWRGYVTLSMSKEKLNAILCKETGIEKDWHAEIDSVDGYTLANDLSIFGNMRFCVEELEYTWQVIRCYIYDKYNICIKELPFDIENGGVKYHVMASSIEDDKIYPLKVSTYKCYLERMLKDGNRHLKFVEKDCHRKPNELYKDLKYV